MIIRIFSDGQYRVPEDAVARLQELDVKTVEAADTGDGAAFGAAYATLINHIHTTSERLADDELVPSDLMLPPADITLEEAREEFTGEGLIPD